ncbi:hypothetical protein POM88_047658 [Heracleum sosnowskyi]|uniref:Pentatricopeptide repeat-containing protein n=1 Tax=Heracleum sosnowskyi TaxID=360622 RepID=A0AAD8GU76_9APIA|nr:hypothetical protein POM88_047658 [Heracleum sosnowskyi]
MLWKILVSRTFRHTWDYRNRSDSPYSLSFRRAFYFPESSVSREATKQLSDTKNLQDEMIMKARFILTMALRNMKRIEHTFSTNSLQLHPISTLSHAHERSAKWTKSVNVINSAIKASDLKLASSAIETVSKLIKEDEELFLSEDVLKKLFLVLRKTRTRTSSIQVAKELFNSCCKLLDHSLHKEVAEVPTILAKSFAASHLGELPLAFEEVVKLETHYTKEPFSPFTNLNYLVLAYSDDERTLIFQRLKDLSAEDPQLRFTSALNCIILYNAKTENDVEAQNLFDAITDAFGSTPNIDSYNSMILAYKNVNKAKKGMNMFKDLEQSGVEPNALTFELMAEIQMKAKDSGSAISLINTMKSFGFAVPEKLLKNIAKTKDDDAILGMSESRTPPWKKGWTGQNNMLYGQSHGKPWHISFDKDDYETAKLNEDFNFMDRMRKVKKKKHFDKVKDRKNQKR